MVTINNAVNDEILTVQLYGKIDSANAGEAEAIIMDLLQKNEGKKVVIDADDLQYLSSAGLRIVLKVKKASKDLTVINVNNEVYEIFDMTGFTEMISIEKAYRKVSVEGCEIIGAGANGDVYRLNDDTIIKVYKNADSLEDIKRERELARKAFVLGVPTAIPYDVVKVNDVYGSVFEMIKAQSFAKRLQNNPDELDEIAKAYVDLLKIIHGTEVKDDGLLPSMKAYALKWVADIQPLIQPEKWEKIKVLFEQIPDTYNMIHGDYHIKNVMTQNGESILIDMDTLSYGAPIFEFGQIYNSYIGFGEMDPTVVEKFMGLPYDLCKKLWNKTLHLYFTNADENQLKEIENKIRLVGYVRNIRRLYKFVKKGKEKIETVEFYQNKIETMLDDIQDLTL